MPARSSGIAPIFPPLPLASSPGSVSKAIVWRWNSYCVGWSATATVALWALLPVRRSGGPTVGTSRGSAQDQGARRPARGIQPQRTRDQGRRGDRPSIATAERLLDFDSGEQCPEPAGGRAS